MPPNRTADFRYIYASAVGVALSSNELILKFGVTEDPEKPLDSIFEQAAVAMPLVGAKQLAHALTTLIEHFEAANGVIPLPPERLAELQSIVASKTPRR